MLHAPLVLPRCGEVAELASEFLDGELDEATSARVRLHLAVCTSCARFAVDLAAVVCALHRLGARRP